MSTMSSRPAVEVIAIGSELLQGHITDTNSAVIARSLRSLGLELSRVTLVGDDRPAIAAVLKEALDRAPIILTTGGLGPTVDDPTREAIAAAVGRELTFDPGLWRQIQERFARFGRTPTDNNRRQACMPEGALPLENTVGTAPAFIVEDIHWAIIALPGVPAEMETLLREAVLPYLHQRYPTATVVCTRTLRTSGIGESAVDDLIQDLEHLANPTVGLSAHPGRVDVRLVARAADLDSCQAIIAQAETDLRQRLGPAVYGTDAETLESAAQRAAQARGWRLALQEAGTGGALAGALALAGVPAFSAGILPEGTTLGDLTLALGTAPGVDQAEVGLGLSLTPIEGRFRLDLALIAPELRDAIQHHYGGPPVNAVPWAVSIALDLLRRRLA
jgi:nicotinamide-nucleotide amidase